MKILVTADLHFEHWRHDRQNLSDAMRPVLEEVDALVIAGDVSSDPLRTWPAFLGWLREMIDLDKVWITPGNHDYYDWHLQGDAELRKIVENRGAHFAQKEVLEFDKVRFLCCTLWGNFELNRDVEGAVAAARRRMNDYLLIQKARGGSRITPEDTIKVHRDHLEWLTAAIKIPHKGRTVVVTHHAPSPGIGGPLGPLSPAFCSNLDDWILMHRPDAWLSGHTHRHLSGKVGRTLLRNISFGYPSEIPFSARQSLLRRGLLDTRSSTLLSFD